jgi:hypothetical protein
MDGDDVDPDQLLGVANPLGHDVAEMGDELDAQRADLPAGIADAEVVRDHPLLTRMERAMHGERGSADGDA